MRGCRYKFDNIGSKVKTLAKVTCWIGMAFSAIYGIVLIAMNQAILGLLVIVLGAFGSWLDSLALYAIGESAENSAIAANLIVKMDMERSRQTNNQSTAGVEPTAGSNEA